STTYAHTLANVTGAKTCFQVSVSATVAAGTETFIDSKDGGLTSNLGGTGTVNYATGAVSVTFSDVTTGAVTCSYYVEDATSHGVMDFSIAYTSGVRNATTGDVMPQFDGGGNLNFVIPFSNTYAAFHTRKTWQVTIPTDDSSTG